MNDTTHIVIIGGGFAGTATALNLEKIVAIHAGCVGLSLDCVWS